MSRAADSGPVPAGTADSAETFPVSFAQQRLWFLQQLEPEVSTYRIDVTRRLRGRLDTSVLRRSLEEIVRRHEVLRTTFALEDGQPVQRVRPTAEVAFAMEDLAALPEAERETEASRWILRELEAPFDLAEGPLLRARLYRLAEDDHVLFVLVHHIVFDGWSVEVFLRELSALYAAFSRGEQSPLPALPIQYADFAVWQREALERGLFESQISYWEQELGGELPVLALATDRARRPVQTHRGDEERAEVPPTIVSRLRAVGRQERATLFMTLLAAFHAFLSRYTGQEEILVGTPIAGRTQLETEGLIGFFVNTLVMRGDLAGYPSFRTLLRRVRESSLAAYSNQDFPFEKLVEKLNPQRSLSQTPLFQVMFALQETGPEPLRLQGVSVAPFESPARAARFDLSLLAEVEGEELTLRLLYNTDLYEAATAQRMLRHLGVLLEAVTADPDRPIARVPLLTESESRQLLVEWNRTDAPYSKGKRLHQLFEESAARHPERVAVEQEGEELSYGELDRRANRLARRLRTLGVGRGSLVNVCVERSPEMVVALLGTLKAGGAFVPLDSEDPSDRLAFQFEEAGSPVLLTQKRLVSRLPRFEGRVALLDEGPREVEPEDDEKPPEDPSAASAYMIYTSGSTGQPKGVLVPHRAVVNHLSWRQSVFPLTPEDRFLQKAAYTFDISIWELFAPLVAGARAVLARHGGQRDPRYLLDLIAASRVTVAHFGPALLRAILEEPGLERCEGLRLVFCGGEPLPTELAKRFFERSAAKLHSQYGPTETCIDVTAYPCEPGEERSVVPIGRPIANTRIFILDPRLQPVPIGVPGELHVAGDALAVGYFKRPELTAEKFIEDPFTSEPGGRMFRTGDLARYLSDGNIEFLGRRDRQVKVRGYRIELGEVEAALGRHPAVLQGVVVAREEAGGDGKRLAAYYVAEGSAPSVGELREFLKKTLPDYMVPAAFIRLPALPLLPTGKVDRGALPEPEDIAPASDAYAAPRDPLELQLVQVWEELLPGHSVGLSDNFFELGGHSLLAVRLFDRIEKLTGRKLPLATLFQAPTVGQLAAILREEGWTPPWSALVAIQPGGSKPPLFCVHAVGGNVLTYRDLARRLGPDQPVYGLQAVGLDGRRPPYTTVEDMAAHYIREVRTLRTRGPYFLAGASSGGKMAYEMARQLLAEGEEVGLVALFDTMGPGHLRAPNGKPEWRLKLSGILSRIDLHVGNFLAAPAAEKYRYVKEKSRRLKRRIRVKLRNKRLPANLREVELSTRRALRSYVPRPYPGKVTMFRASKQPTGLPTDPTLGWERVALGGVEVHEVPGHHGAIVYEPRVRFLAEKLRACLARAASMSQTRPRAPATRAAAGGRRTAEA